MKPYPKENLGALAHDLTPWMSLGGQTALALRAGKVIDFIRHPKPETLRSKARDQFFVGHAGKYDSVLIISEMGRPLDHCLFSECSWRMVWRYVK